MVVKTLVYILRELINIKSINNLFTFLTFLKTSTKTSVGKSTSWRAYMNLVTLSITNDPYDETISGSAQHRVKTKWNVKEMFNVGNVHLSLTYIYTDEKVVVCFQYYNCISHFTNETTKLGNFIHNEITLAPICNTRNVFRELAAFIRCCNSIFLDVINDKALCVLTNYFSVSQHIEYTSVERRKKI